MPPARRLSFDERRAEILTAAARAIVRHGVHAFRIQDVADEAGVSQPLVSRHFRSREQLVLEAFVQADERALALLTERVPGGPPGRERLLAFLRLCMDPDPTLSESWDLWHEIWTYGTYSEPIREAVQERQRTFIAHVAEIVAAGQGDGSLSRAAGPAEAALHLVTVLDGVGLSIRYGVLDRPRALELVEGIVARAL